MPQPNKAIYKRWIVAVAVAMGLSSPAFAEPQANPLDPWEGFNRGMFAFNDAIDTALIKPVAVGYEYVVPEPLRILVTNLFSNLNDVVIGINDLLQGRGEQAYNDFGRVLINSTLGFGGLFDVAGNAGWYKNDNDFGVTFARWGADAGPYLVMPILGPSDVRDALGAVANIAASPLSFVVHDPTAYYVSWGVNFVSARANLLPAEKIIEEAATDKYSYLRDAFMQNRLNLIYDGEPPPQLEGGQPGTAEADIPAGSKENRQLTDASALQR